MPQYSILDRHEFGLWQKTGRLNDIIRGDATNGEGLGEAVGRAIEEGRFLHRDLSIATAGLRLGIPVTSHVTIGENIIPAHPNCDGAALGATSFADFLIFCRSGQDLEGEVFLNIGSAMTGPEIYLKALLMARNIARQQGKELCHYTTLPFLILCHSSRTGAMARRARTIRSITTAPGKRSSPAPSPMAANPLTSRAITVKPSPRSGITS